MASDTLDRFRQRFGDILRCPGTDTPVQAHGTEETLVAADSRRRVAACRDGTLDFVSPDVDDRGDQAGFGYQWEHVLRGPLADSIAYNNTPEDLKQKLIEMLRIPEAGFRGLRILDFGSGHGQYCRVFARMGAVPLGVDLSEVVYRCTSENAKSSNPLDVTFVRGDALNPCLAPHSFDVVISIGMAHHTPDTKKAVLNVARCVKPGGRFLLYIYETGEVGYINLRHKFPLPSKFPRPLMLWFCRLLAIPLSVYLAGRKGKIPTPRTYKAAFLGLFDAYIPTYSWTYPPEECMAWMREAGLVNISRPMSCFFYGERPPA